MSVRAASCTSAAVIACVRSGRCARRSPGPDADDAAYWLARALRDAKPDDVLELVDWDRIQRDWPRMVRYLGQRKDFWAWWLEKVGRAVDAQ